VSNIRPKYSLLSTLGGLREGTFDHEEDCRPCAYRALSCRLRNGRWWPRGQRLEPRLSQSLRKTGPRLTPRQITVFSVASPCVPPVAARAASLERVSPCLRRSPAQRGSGLTSGQPSTLGWPGPWDRSLRLANDLAEEPRQRLGRRYIWAVAGGNFEVAPGRIGFEAPGELQEDVVGVLSCAVNVAAGERRCGVSQLQRLGKGLERLRSPARSEPVEVRLRGIGRRRVWRNKPVFVRGSSRPRRRTAQVE